MATPPTATRDPFPPGLQKLAASSGIAFALLLLFSFLLLGGESPSASDPVREWTAYANDNEDSARIGTLVIGLAAFQFLFFLGCLRDLLGQAEAGVRGFTRITHIVYAGGIAGIGGLTVGDAMAAAALSYEEASPELIRGLAMLSSAPYVLAVTGFGTMLYAIFFIVQRTRVLPAWLGWVALAGGLFFLLTLLIALSEDYDSGFAIGFPVAFLSLFIFSIGASVAMIKRVRT